MGLQLHWLPMKHKKYNAHQIDVFSCKVSFCVQKNFKNCFSFDVIVNYISAKMKNMNGLTWGWASRERRGRDLPLLKSSRFRERGQKNVNTLQQPQRSITSYSTQSWYCILLFVKNSFKTISCSNIMYTCSLFLAKEFQSAKQHYYFTLDNAMLLLHIGFASLLWISGF